MSDELKACETKWFWMMDYCKKNHLPAAQSWAWNRAENAWNARADHKD